MADEAFKYADEILEDLKKYDAPLLQYYEHKLRGLAFQIKGEYENSNHVWKNWENYLQAHPLFAGDKGFGEAAIYQMDNYAYLFQYGKAKKCAEDCLKYFDINSPNRLIFLENYFLLAMRNADYLNAREIFNLGAKSERLYRMPVTNQEKWKIFEPYLYYTEKGQEAIKVNKFDLEGLLKDIHVYKKDKAGFNVSMLIIQICILIRMKPDEKPIDKMDALKLYRRRYLKGDVSYRVNVFMDLLFELDKANYSHSAIKKKEMFLLKKLKDKPIAHTENIEGLEVIPFERLWEMVKEDIKE